MAVGAHNDIVWTSYIPGFRWLEQHFANPETHAPAYHVTNGILISLIIVCLALWARSKIESEPASDDDLVPDAKLTVRNVLELMVSGITKIMEDSMGHNAPRFLFLVGALGFFILFSNLSGLVPGFMPPTDNLNTNLAMSLMVFVVYNYYGIKEHGISYLKQFAGPILWLAPLMFLIELLSHLFRPMSLSIRLFGNMFGDHMVLGIFSDLVPLLVPVIFMILGIVVSMIQAFVFAALTTVYIALAVSHDH